MANATVTVLEADGVTQTDVVVLDVGRQAAAASKSVALSTEDKAVLDSIVVTEDAAAAANPTGPALMAVRRDTLSTSEVSADGDIIALKATNKGKLHVAAELRIGDTVIDTGSGTGGSATPRVVIDSAQLAALLTSYVPIATTNATQVAFPTDHPTLAVAADTSRILNGASGTSLTPKWAVISASSSGDNTIVSAVTSKKIRVLFWDLSPNAAVNAKWRSSTTTDKTGLYYMGGQGNGNSRPFNPVGWFETTAGEALTLNLSSAVAVGGVVGYVEV